MRHSLVKSVLALVAVLAASPLVSAQDAPPAGAARPANAQSAAPSAPAPFHDLSGVWNGNLRIDGKVAPMTPEAQARFNANTIELKSDRPITIDPAFTCHPAGVPHTYQNGAFPFEIVQTPKRIFIFYESAHNWREIWMDGREIPKDSDPLWMGYSVGHWEGDDLVVETGDFNDLTWLDAGGHPHSDALHVTERFHRADLNHLTIEFTITDPKSYTQPWMMKGAYQYEPTWEIGEAFCVPEDQTNFEKHVLEPNAKPTTPKPKS